MPPSDLPARPDRRLKRIETLGYLLDDAIRIPLIGYRIGWDAIIGLIPGFGDVAGLLLSAYIVYEASRFDLPRATLFRMVFNVALEALVGLVPFFGDVFDATWKSNARNLDLLNDHLALNPERARASGRRFMGIVLAVLLVVVVLLGVLVVLLLQALAQALGV